MLKIAGSGDGEVPNPHTDYIICHLNLLGSIVGPYPICPRNLCSEAKK
jgi:hypothetical protein